MGEPWNTFVEGDNLDVLAGLDDASFDVAYLDPPYNRATSLAYRDDFRDGARATRHAAWVAMMRPRLEHVRRVLRPTGALFCSIDDHEVAHLRLLLDEVFGERAFLAQVVVNLNPKGRQLGRGFATSHEYLLVVARDPRACVLDPTSAETVDPRDFSHELPDGRRFRLLPLRNTNKKFHPGSVPTLHHTLHGDPAGGRVATEPFEGSVEVRPVFGDGAPAVWRWSAALVAERSDDLVCRVVRGRLGERVDVFQRDWLGDDRRKKLTTIWTAEEVGSTDTAAGEVRALVGKAFDSPKPTGLLRRVVATYPADARVLDPFAGSGTTGHAVALLNAADGGTRTCLSVNAGEPVRPGTPAHDAGFRSVADITRARLRAVAATVGGGYAEG
ncbi:site-specific DNA-methyltransferase [Nocardioides zeae]|uniref:Methyltransferase n=1 Tax=Nocardioides imazamoxiresistens TaxID=3231893 RepID=A0ABU3PYK6_9ACTN|nr:site-specific DNA-methyltransferase [Nocardioides zeae]MDT9593961.1 site-specific DNA-methyltransferase [Nocardioides zeae]